MQLDGPPIRVAKTRRPAVNGWVYFLGEMNGLDIKIGRSTGRTLRQRVDEVNRDQMSDAKYALLAGFRGDRKDEAFIKRYFRAHVRTDKGSRTEYFHPDPELVNYVNWLRQWWWVTISPDDDRDTVDAVEPEVWMPAPERQLPPPPSDPDQLIQPFQDLTGPLAGTPWDWFLEPRQSIQDFFTPEDIVDAARVAMAGLDLDAASHPLANRRHRITDYFHINRSAFEHPWKERTWLNPPYGNNAPWFDRILDQIDCGNVRQLCMLSPVWAFTTDIARPFMRRCSAFVLLVPTPKFWGNSENRTGTNNPHMIAYYGDRKAEFLNAFAEYGVPVEIAWDKVVSLREAA